ncbi:hypothetical protein [Oceanobacillus alkalisoli]|uniref:hypothetical protein n=1 Tax=Oceanobacillus alkalisoli TaxID=2925113 RepID=UPI001EE47BA5|nr:hypothetical protein [Oceanobacillus alkalisoli]MCG5104914.1 hypothetical protein [Oceanobacillus alkalisoli]
MILFPFILLGIIVVFTFLLKKLQLDRFGYWLLGGYSILLVISMVAYSLIPAKDFVDETEFDENRVYLIHELTERRIPVEEFEPYKSKEWSFELSDREEVAIYDTSSDDYYFPVVIERVEGQETIDITLYEVKPDNEPEPVKDDWNETTIHYDSGEITVNQMGKKLYRYAEVSKEPFPYTQFREGGSHFMHFDEVFYHENVLYIALPTDVQFNNESELDVNWLN